MHCSAAKGMSTRISGILVQVYASCEIHVACHWSLTDIDDYLRSLLMAKDRKQHPQGRWEEQLNKNTWKSIQTWLLSISVEVPCSHSLIFTCPLGWGFLLLVWMKSLKNGGIGVVLQHKCLVPRNRDISLSLPSPVPTGHGVVMTASFTLETLSVTR